MGTKRPLAIYTDLIKEIPDADQLPAALIPALSYDPAGAAATAVSSHESTYNHSNFGLAYSHKTTEDALSGLVYVDGAGNYSAKLIGTDVQAYSAKLASLAGLTYASTSFVKMTGANTFTLDTGTYDPSGTGHTEATDHVSTHAALITGVHGLVFTAGKSLTLTESLTLNTVALNGVLYGSSLNAVGSTAIGAEGQILRVGASPFVPAWTTATYPATTTAYKMLVSTGTSVIGELAAVGATGEYLKGNTGAIPSWATLNQAAVAGLTTTDSPTFAGLTGTSVFIVNPSLIVPFEVNPTISTATVGAAGLRVAPTLTGAGNGPAALNAVATLKPSASIPIAYGFIGRAKAQPPAGVTITSLYGFYGRTDTGPGDAGNGAVTTSSAFLVASPVMASIFPTNQRGLYVQNQGVSGIQTAHGIYVDPQSGATNNYAAYFGGNVGIGPAATAPLGVLCIDGGLHVGGMSDPGDNNLLVDGTIAATGTLSVDHVSEKTASHGVVFDVSLYFVALAAASALYGDAYSGTSTDHARLRFRKSHQDTVGHTATIDGEVLGGVQFWGNSGADFSSGAFIGAYQEGAAGTYTPTSLRFNTSNGTNPWTERMRITKDGSVLIGTTTDGMTAAGSLAIAQDFAHRGTKVGFFNVAPTTRTTAYTQTYSTAARTVPDPSQTITGPTPGLNGYGLPNQNDFQTYIWTPMGQLRDNLTSLYKVVNSIIDDLQAYGLLQ